MKAVMRVLRENTLKDALEGNPTDDHPGAARHDKEMGLM